MECCRAVWAVCHDPAENDTRYFAPAKFNCGVDPITVSYQITNPSGKVKILETDIRKWAEEIYTAAKAEGYSESTIDRAKDALGIKSARRGFGKGSYVVWSLPIP